MCETYNDTEISPEIDQYVIYVHRVKKLLRSDKDLGYGVRADVQLDVCIHSDSAGAASRNSPHNPPDNRPLSVVCLQHSTLSQARRSLSPQPSLHSSEIWNNPRLLAPESFHSCLNTSSPQHLSTQLPLCLGLSCSVYAKSMFSFFFVSRFQCAAWSSFKHQ